MSPARPSVGQFVRVESNGLGIGKIAAVTRDSIEIEYFDSISGRHRLTVGAEDVERARVQLQRRCYWREEQGWRVGRVVWQGEEEYGVRPPDSEIDLRVREADLYLRWSNPIEDPIDVLIAGGNESPYFHHCRLPFVRSVVEQRAASHGMHGVLSSVVELHEHQLEVVRRVLEDPKQRYLLADEVGLGKTIEAGLILRQYLLDQPDGHVVVIAPPMLRRQWVVELREKFLIDDFPRAIISVLSHEDPEAWSGSAQDSFGRTSLHTQAGLLVVDEVHNLAAEADSAYSALTELAAAVPRILLLSATPLLHNESTFLRMLHLLDPDVYPLDDLDGFRRRIRERQALGTAFFTFRADIPPFLLREKVNVLRSMFEADEQLGNLLDAVEVSLDDGDDVLRDAVTTARMHISETYRVHRRLLRTRRSDALTANFPVRGRERPEPLSGTDALDLAVEDWLDDWRDYIRSTLLDDDDDNRGPAREALLAFAERSAHVPLLQACASYRLSASPEGAALAELTPNQESILRTLPLDTTERAILERAAALTTDPATSANLTDFLRRERLRTIVFTTFTRHAEAIAALLRERLGEIAVATHLLSDDPAEVEAGLEAFRDADQACRILVCDRSAEEGRNLQFADQAIHLDLPFSPNRLEQRIGRLDRYGQGARIPMFFVPYAQTTISGAWVRCLADGFAVFDRSIASLQFAVDVIMPRLLDNLLDEGPSGLDQMTSLLPDELDRERDAIAEQDALDAIETSSEMGALSTSLDELEDMWFQIQKATEGLLCDHPGNLRFHRVVDRNQKHVRLYRLTTPGKSAHLNSMPLVAWDVLHSTFRSVVDKPGSYFRRVAVADPGARLFRIGEPLIDALAEYMRWDDRGQTFAYWRTNRRVTDDIAYFRFDYLVDADTEEAERCVTEAEPPLDRNVIQRRADAFLVPTLETIWTTVDGDEVTDRTVISALEVPYDPAHGDINLNMDRRWALEQLVGAVDWEARCRAARKTSEHSLRRRPTFSAAAEQAVANFEASIRASSTKRRIRLRFLEPRQRTSEEDELARDQLIDKALAAGLRHPRVRLDAVGIVVLSPTRPVGPGFPLGKHQ